MRQKTAVLNLASLCFVARLILPTLSYAEQATHLTATNEPTVSIPTIALREKESASYSFSIQVTRQSFSGATNAFGNKTFISDLDWMPDPNPEPDPEFEPDPQELCPKGWEGDPHLCPVILVGRSKFYLDSNFDWIPNPNPDPDTELKPDPQELCPEGWEGDPHLCPLIQFGSSELHFKSNLDWMPDPNPEPDPEFEPDPQELCPDGYEGDPHLCPVILMGSSERYFNPEFGWAPDPNPEPDPEFEPDPQELCPKGWEGDPHLCPMILVGMVETVVESEVDWLPTIESRAPIYVPRNLVLEQFKHQKKTPEEILKELEFGALEPVYEFRPPAYVPNVAHEQAIKSFMDVIQNSQLMTAELIEVLLDDLKRKVPEKVFEAVVQTAIKEVAGVGGPQAKIILETLKVKSTAEEKYVNPNHPDYQHEEKKENQGEQENLPDKEADSITHNTRPKLDLDSDTETNHYNSLGAEEFNRQQQQVEQSRTANEQSSLEREFEEMRNVESTPLEAGTTYEPDTGSDSGGSQVDITLD